VAAAGAAAAGPHKRSRTHCQSAIIPPLKLAIAPVTAAAEDGHAGAGIAQPLRHGPHERTGTARDQDRCCHDVSLHRQDETGLEYRLHGHHPWQRPTGQTLAPAGHGPLDGNALLHVRPLTG
jgi:hypothetical protein